MITLARGYSSHHAKTMYLMFALEAVCHSVVDCYVSVVVMQLMSHMNLVVQCCQAKDWQFTIHRVDQLHCST